MENEESVKAPNIELQMSQEQYHQLLIELQKAISEGNVDSLKGLSTSLDQISHALCPETLRDHIDNTANPFQKTNIVIFTCKSFQVEILKQLFGESISALNILSVAIGKTTTLPNEEDEAKHTAFYYAINHGSVDLLDTLITKWPGDYFTDHSEELDSIISRAYNELKVRNVPLSEKVEFFIENQLVNLRFFSGIVKNIELTHDNIKDRIDLLLENIRLLTSHREKVDDTFIFRAKFIAQNIHTLKQIFRSSYYRLPWEELWFCLVSFISYHTKQDEVDFFNRAILSKDKVLNYLHHFATRLEVEKHKLDDMDISILCNFPKLKREQIIDNMTTRYPQFEGLYYGYQKIRDNHSLHRIYNSLKLTLTAVPEEREGRLIITRALQVVGGYLKNTLEFPKLSNTGIELLLHSSSMTTRELILDLCNSLEEGYLLTEGIEVEGNRDVNFYIAILKDIKEFMNMIRNILYKNKIKAIRIQLNRIIYKKKLDKINRVTKSLNDIKLYEMFRESYKSVEHKMLEQLVETLDTNITEDISYKDELLNLIKQIINLEEKKMLMLNKECSKSQSLNSFCIKICTMTANENTVKEIKILANKIVDFITPKVESHQFKIIAQLLVKLLSSKRRSQDNIPEHTKRLAYETLYFAEFQTCDMKWFDNLRAKINLEGFFIPESKERKKRELSEEEYLQKLVNKIAELKSVLNSNAYNKPLIDELIIYNSNKNLQAVVDIIVLDIMTILVRSKKCVENNILFLDDNYPILTGLCLHSHLAHNNDLSEIFFSVPSISIILNAKKLAEEDILENDKGIGRLVKEDLQRLKYQFVKNLEAVENNVKMFTAVEKGNIDDFNKCVKNGADIYSRNINLWTTLHFAARGKSIELVGILVKEHLNLNAKDDNGQTPLHIAVANGRECIANLLVEEGAMIEAVDNCGRTPLHIAVDTDERVTLCVLLNFEADVNAKDADGLTPLHIAVSSNYKDVIDILLMHGANCNAIDNFNRLPFQMTVDKKITNLLALTQKFVTSVKSNIAADTEKHIKAGAFINAQQFDCETALHYAASKGNELMVDVLLRNKADPNAIGKEGFTPLHYAAISLHLNVIKTLLAYGAIYNPLSDADITPLDSTTDESIVNLFNLITESYDGVKSGKFQVVVELNNTNDIDIVKAVMNTRDRNNKSLVDTAMDCDYQYRKELNHVLQSEIPYGNLFHDLISRERFDEIIKLAAKVLKKRKAVLGLDNPATWDLLVDKGKAHYKMHNFDAALAVYEDLVEKQKHRLGEDHWFTLKTRSSIALCLHKKKFHEEALQRYSQIYLKQKEILTLNHKDVLRTQCHMAFVLDFLDRKDEALSINLEVLEKQKQIYHIEHPLVMSLENNVAYMLSHMNRFDEALQLYVELYKKRMKVLGIHHPDTLRTLHNLVLSLYSLNRGEEGFQHIKYLLHFQKLVLGFDHYDTLNTQAYLAQKLYDQGNILGALKMYKECLGEREKLLGPNHEHIVYAKKVINSIQFDMHRLGHDTEKMLLPLSKGLIFATSEGDRNTVRILLESGSYVNEIDKFGKTPLHHAAEKGHIEIVNILLKHEADLTQTCDKETTPLHVAALKGCKEIVEIFLEHIGQEKMNNFINTKTVCKGSTALHMAIKRGSLKIIHSLLKRGAIYNDKTNDNQTSQTLTKNQNINNLFKLIELLFEGAHNGDMDIISKLEAAEPHEFTSFINTRNVQGRSLLQVAILNKHKHIAAKLLEMMKKEKH